MKTWVKSKANVSQERTAVCSHSPPDYKTRTLALEHPGLDHCTEQGRTVAKMQAENAGSPAFILRQQGNSLP